MTTSSANNRSPLTVEVSGLSKRYPGVKALEDVTVRFEAGRITAVVGENGAGKSTLMTILAGLQAPQSGTVSIGGVQVQSFTPHQLLVEHRVALVPQEISLLQERSVAENVLLGREGGILPSRRELVGRTKALLEEIDTPLDPSRRAGTLSVAEQQLVLIARALARDCGVLILDEPTTSLTPEEVGRLFRLLRRLRSRGTTIIYVSHRLPEVFAMADAIHVLRDGHVAASFDASEVDSQSLVRAMVGRELAERSETHPRSTRPPAVTVTRLSGTGFRDVSLTLGEGEIVGLAGLPDSGRRELVEAMFGAAKSTGTVEMRDGPVRLRAPRDAIAAGIGYVPAERKAQGIFPSMSVAGNLAVLEMDSLSRAGIVRRGAIDHLARERLAQFDVRGRADSEMSQLSGGNQQKVILARWLARGPKLLLLDEPTRGVDVAAKADIYQRLEAAANVGTTILLSSSDVPELLRCCDRIVVMARGQITAEVAGEDATEERVMSLATGIDKEAAA